jgi:hypothetical protein
MTNRVLLNNVEHRDLRVDTRHSVAFGDGINQVLVFPTEFEDLQREYPILFRRDADGNFPGRRPARSRSRRESVPR